MFSSVVSGNPFGVLTYRDLPSSGVAHKTFPRSLYLTSHSGIQYSVSSVRIMGSDGVGERMCLHKISVCFHQTQVSPSMSRIHFTSFLDRFYISCQTQCVSR